MTTLTTKLTADQLLFEKAKRHIPGGVNSPVRAFAGVGGTPVFISRAKGAYMYDTQGREYIDYVGSWGPMSCSPQGRRCGKARL